MKTAPVGYGSALMRTDLIVLTSAPGGTKDGLSLFDRRQEAFLRISEQDGLPNSAISNLLGDAQGNLWISTNQGLSKFNPESRSFRNYDVEEGLPANEFSGGAAFKSASGEMFFGGFNGFTRFVPERIKTS